MIKTRFLTDDEIKETVKTSYFYSGLLDEHGFIKTPHEFCKITNPKFRLVLFEEPGKDIPFYEDKFDFNDKNFVNEFNYCVLSGIQK